ncbi:hypothetical protein [uncultured Croceitalea sp.]|uniref:hypothetical protein n=1 Tax=uncultured Croceitalea sp. TaxID=1798908 RepID=UPI003305F5E0
MEIKTSDSYQKEVLEKYKRNRGGELSTYLLNPTPRLIKQACILLLDKRTSTDDINILNCFFQFRDEESRLKEVKSFDNDRFKPIVNFLKGRTNSTSDENIELISWLIDFKPRPLRQYLKPDNPIFEGDDSKPEIIHELGRLDKKNVDNLERKKEEERKKLGDAKRKKEKKKRRRMLIISISISFGALLLTVLALKYPMNFDGKLPECMTWADSLYVRVSCEKGPFSQFGTTVDSLDQMKLNKMKKVKVDAAYKFFSNTDEPLIWYYKKSNGEIEYFTAPGLHPTNGETLRKITPYIIQTYVPKHMNKKSSFVQ